MARYYREQREADQWTPARATMWRTRDHKIVVRHGEELGELYDLRADLHEQQNLWDAPTSLRFART